MGHINCVSVVALAPLSSPGTYKCAERNRRTGSEMGEICLYTVHGAKEFLLAGASQGIL